MPFLVTPTPCRDTRLRLICASCGQRFEAERRSAVTCSPACRQARSRLLRATTPPLPGGLFDLIVADPPLGYRTWSPKGQGRSPGTHYQPLDLAALCRLETAIRAHATELLKIEWQWWTDWQTRLPLHPSKRDGKETVPAFSRRDIAFAMELAAREYAA